ncbi:conserved phage C-terminal domain-containing protein [Burkholderia gladioli]|uniref:conserved phage C-terminal domain-containing protein n=1 Tax=Burkholderia gladioli TaxID=28095 RepID=UPI00163F548B|nr:conserved phage C-terminal domain-containing protein [Burkholderia gladioli]
MARIRSIKPDFWTSETIVELPFEARLFFIGSWNFADDNGNLQRSSKKLKMQIFPADLIDCEPIIQTLIDAGLFIEYSVNGEDYLSIKGFREHQVVNRPSKTAIPVRPEPDLLDGLSESSVTEGKGKEGKGKDMSGKPDSVSPPVQVLDHLNAKANRSYQAVPANLKLIAARLAEGATVDQLKAVVDAKVRDWQHDPKMREYLRPATLFNAEKCGQYVGALGAGINGSAGSGELVRTTRGDLTDNPFA